MRYCEIPSITGDERAIDRRDRGRAARVGIEVARGRRRGPGPSRGGEPDRPRAAVRRDGRNVPGGTETHGSGSRSSPTSTPSPTTGRSRSSKTDGVFRSRRRHDPRRRQQGGRRRAHGARGAAGRRARRRSGSSWSSPSPRSRGCAGPQALGRRDPALGVRLRPRPRDRDRRGDRRRADLQEAASPSSAASRPMPGCDPRTAAARSPPRPPRSRRMELGRLDDETTANVGVIDGGTAPNVVAGRCHVEGEARSARRRAGRARSPRRMVDACSWAAGEAGVRRRRARRDLFRGYRIKPTLAAAGDRRGGARGARHRAGRDHDRRRQRRQRPALGGLRRVAARQRDRDEPHPRRVGLGGGARRRCSTSARRSSPRPGAADVLKLRRGTVVAIEDACSRSRSTASAAAPGRTSRWSARAEVGDEVVVNVAALDLGLGSGGFDIVHVNLTRGLERRGDAAGDPRDEAELHLASACRRPDRASRSTHRRCRPRHAAGAGPAAARPPRPGGLGGGARRRRGRGSASCRRRAAALPGSLSPRRPRAARARPARRITSPPSPVLRRRARGDQPGRRPPRRGRQLGWDAAIVGPGPGILGSATRYGHGGMAALEAAHAALALGLPTLLSPRMSSADPRPRHLGLSHHTLLRPRAAPGRGRGPGPARARRALAARRRRARGGARGGARAACTGSARSRSTSPATPARGLPQRTMGRDARRGPAVLRRAAGRRRRPRAAASGAEPPHGRRAAAAGARLHRQGTGRRAETGSCARRCRDRPLPASRSMPASRRCCSTSSPTSSSSAASRATRSTAYRTDLLQYGAFLAEREHGRARGRGRRRRRVPRRPRRRRRRTSPPAARRPSTARPPACAPSTATCAAAS